MKNGKYRVLAVGDVVGKNGLEFIKRNFRKIRERYDIDFAVVNGENSAPGNGVTPESAQALFMAGADVITGGNHTFRRAEIYPYLEDNERIIRPANYPPSSPGFGYCITENLGVRILVMNLLGTVYMESLENPFDTAVRILTREEGNYDLAVCDFHGEATSEKLAFGYHFDGRLNIVFGTHTHVQTNDAQVLPGGCGYVTDLGMTGSKDSVLGVKKEIIIKKLTTKMPVRFEEADGETVFCGAVFEFDLESKKVTDVSLVNEIH